MKESRRDFLKCAGAAGISLARPDVLVGETRSQDTAPVINKVAVDHAVATLEDGSRLATPRLIPDDPVEQGRLLGHIVRERDLATVPVRAPVSGYLWQLGACHGVLCDASLPAQHPYAEEGETVAMIVECS